METGKQTRETGERSGGEEVRAGGGSVAREGSLETRDTAYFWPWENIAYGRHADGTRFVIHYDRNTRTERTET